MQPASSSQSPPTGPCCCMHVFSSAPTLHALLFCPWGETHPVLRVCICAWQVMVQSDQSASSWLVAGPHSSLVAQTALPAAMLLKVIAGRTFFLAFPLFCSSPPVSAMSPQEAVLCPCKPVPPPLCTNNYSYQGHYQGAAATREVPPAMTRGGGYQGVGRAVGFRPVMRYARSAMANGIPTTTSFCLVAAAL